MSKNRVFYALMTPAFLTFGVSIFYETWLLLIPWFIVTAVIYWDIRRIQRKMAAQNRNTGG